MTDVLSSRSDALNEDDRGFLDHYIDLTSGYNRITEIVTGVGGDLRELTQSLQGATAEFTQISANPSASSPRIAQTVARKLADRIEKFNSRLSQANAEYADIARDTEDSLEQVISFQLDQSQLTDPRIAEQTSVLQDTQSKMIDARDTFLNLAATMDELPRLERRLNRATKRGSKEVRIFADNVNKSITSIYRAIKEYD